MVNLRREGKERRGGRGRAGEGRGEEEAFTESEHCDRKKLKKIEEKTRPDQVVPIFVHFLLRCAAPIHISSFQRCLHLEPSPGPADEDVPVLPPIHSEQHVARRQACRERYYFCKGSGYGAAALYNVTEARSLRK